MNRPDELALRLFDALGLDSTGVRSARIIIEAGGVPMLLVERFVFDEDVFDSVFEEYQIVRRQP